ncbi:GNAT family N-acetyltransferase [Butyrivibrio proteoclasticus]|uniref:GNAT family N-acetyltransferase n=1 Tax=Butyrivibrio proteoclasticus TaxID=43305 RepID=UPI00047E3FCE|nr:GNAT family N-acetyltransferase [Butyrivibrio proteoclasticus]
MIKTLEDIFGENETLSMDIHGCIRRKISNRLVRDIYEPADAFTISFTYFDPESFEYEKVAFMKLLIQTHKSLEEAMKISDARGGDEYSATNCAAYYYNNFMDEADIACFEENECQVPICEMHNLYISPKFRGKGLSEALIMQLPNILAELGYTDAIITTYINPFKEQKELSEVKELSSESFGGYCDNGEETISVDKNVVKAAEKFLKKCGFEDCGNRYYATTAQKLVNLGEKESPAIGQSYGLRASEYEC